MTEHIHEFHWYPAAANEQGWKCCFCDERPGEPPGFSPRLDRERLDAKVFALIDEMHNSKLIHVSNGSEGDYLIGQLRKRCAAEDRFDQQSILLFLLELDTQSHAAYWQKISNAILAGKDERKRCECGKLANVFSGDKAFCSEHWKL